MPLTLMIIMLYWNYISPDTTGCDVNLNVTETKQYFATEGYPHRYKNNQDCNFTFEAPPGRRIVIIFVVFDLHHGHDFIHLRKLTQLSKKHLQNTDTH